MLHRLVDKPLKFKDGQKIIGFKKNLPIKEFIMVDVPFDADGKALVSIKTAMKILGQMGKGYKTAYNQHSQMRNWKVEELPPEGFSSPEIPQKSKTETLIDLLGGEENLDSLIEQISKKNQTKKTRQVKEG